MKGLTQYFGKKLSDGDKHMINAAFFRHRITVCFFGFLGGVVSYSFGNGWDWFYIVAGAGIGFFGMTVIEILMIYDFRW